ncbi:MAG TPA: polyphenol oxidase family protein [Acidimicrobiales bacterium]|nr:polyphenol oxidase family protein [Acidimicrobiales bacterium]
MATPLPTLETAPGAIPLGPAMVRCTGRAEGDMADATGHDEHVLARRRSVVARSWTWLRQVHGAEVVVVTHPGGSAGREADAAVSDAAGVALSVVTADCAPVALASPEGVIGVAHAGWRGLVAGVVEDTVAAMARLGASSVEAVIGPCIGPECYQFGARDLDEVVARLGEEVRAETSSGRPALDIPGATRAALRRAGVDRVTDVGICTACSAEHWSWRARGDRQRQATVVWCP